MRPLRSPRTAAVAAFAAVALALGGTTAATAATNSGSDNRPFPDRVFASDSFWYRELPDATPTDPNSRAIVDYVVEQAEQAWGSPGKPNIAMNTDFYTPPMYVAAPGDPVVTFRFHDCQGAGTDYGLVRDHLTNVRIPADAVAAEGSDGEMVVYDPATDRLTEVWQAKRTDDGGWSACWGGSIEDASDSHGVFPGTFGVTATGLPLTGGVITAEELRTGKIDHVVGLAIPKPAHQVHSAPAVRHDGWNPSGRTSLAQGQMMRLPASLDLDSLNLSPAARAIAEAAQRYGVVLWDTSGAVGFRLEASQGFASDPYPEIFRGRYGSQEMAGDPARGEDPFPLDQLEVLPMNWETPIQRPSAQSESAPKPAPAPAPAPKPAPSPGSDDARRVPHVHADKAVLFGDTFERTVAEGWGGRWSVWPGVGSAVTDGQAVLVPPQAGSTVMARTTDFWRRDQSVDARFVVGSLPRGASSDVYVTTRVQPGPEYRTGVEITESGDLRLFVNVRAGGRDRNLAIADLENATIRPGQTLRVLTETDGAAPTSLRAKVWVEGTPEPSDWQIETTDATAALAGHGGIGVEVVHLPTASAVADVRLASIAVVDPSS